MRFALLSVVVALVAASACASPLSDAYKTFYPVLSLQTPSGHYEGSKYVMGENILVSVSFVSSTQVDVAMSGPMSVNCKGQGYSLGEDGDISLSGACVEQSLKSAGLTIDVLKYDAPSDSVDLVAMYESVLKISVSLSHTKSLSAVHPTSEVSLSHLLKYLPLVNLEDPSGVYEGTKSVVGVQINATVNVTSATTATIQITGAIKVDCEDEPISYSDGVITVPNATTAGDCVHDALAAGGVTLKEITYDAASDSITIKVKYGFLTVSVDLEHVTQRQLSLLKTRHQPKTAVARHSAVPMPVLSNYLRLAALTNPAGIYTGSKSVLGVKVVAVMTIVNDTDLSLTLSGPISLNCSAEPYTYDNGVVTLTNIGQTGDCVHDVLKTYGATMSSVTYDGTSDQIDINVKYGFISLKFELDHINKLPTHIEHALATPTVPLGQLVDTWYDIFALADPAGTYSGSKSILGSTIDVSLTVGSDLSFDVSGAVKIACDAEAYVYSDGVLTITNLSTQGDCVHDALEEYNATLEGIVYDTSSDEITVKLKYLVLSLDVVCQHQ